jgi:hypothetical protein
MITVGTLEPGEFRWIDLLRVRIACMSCGDPATARNPVSDTCIFVCVVAVGNDYCTLCGGGAGQHWFPLYGKS